LPVSERMDLGVAATPADADRLEVRPLFHPLPSGGPSHAYCRSAPRSVARLRPPAPRTRRATRPWPPSARCDCRASLRQAQDRLGRPIDRRRILPPATRLQHVHDAADHPTVIDARHTPCLVRQHRLQSRPLPVVQPELARHLRLHDLHNRSPLFYSEGTEDSPTTARGKTE
jgi:hypothetical protein